MSDLIKRIGYALYDDADPYQVLRDCRAKIERLNADLERERMRLSVCGVIAMSNTKESAERNRQIHDDYKSGSLACVIKMVDSEMSLRAENEEIRRCADAFEFDAECRKAIIDNMKDEHHLLLDALIAEIDGLGKHTFPESQEVYVRLKKLNAILDKVRSTK